MTLEMHPCSRYKKFWIVVFCILMGLTLAQSTVPAAVAEQTKDEKARKRMLKREAANALWRLNKAMDEEGFYSGRVRLNIWRSAAKDAGTFDQVKYDEFKKQLYEKSVNKSLECYELFFEQENFHDANMCLQTWKVHSKEIGIYDPAKYNELKTRLDNLKEKKSNHNSIE